MLFAIVPTLGLRPAHVPLYGQSGHQMDSCERAPILYDMTVPISVPVATGLYVHSCPLPSIRARTPTEAAAIIRRGETAVVSSLPEARRTLFLLGSPQGSIEVLMKAAALSEREITAHLQR